MAGPSLFPNPAATLPGEADVLARVVADQSDLAAKLVYADWLQDRDDPRGPFLRTFLARAGEPWRKNLPDAAGVPPAWCELVGINLLQGIRKAGLATHTSAVLSLARPALTPTAVPADDASIPVGASKFGGHPDLPAGVEWPVWERGPLGFLGQFNLTELRESPAARDLPEGWLSVFYDAGGEVWCEPGDAGGWRMMYFRDTDALARRDPPPDLVAENTFRACTLAFAEILTLPDHESPWQSDIGRFGSREGYGELTGDGYAHRVLGHPTSLQSSVVRDRSTLHLMTIDSDDSPGWMWGDTGLLYITIGADDFAARRFGRAVLEMQCC